MEKAYNLARSVGYETTSLQYNDGFFPKERILLDKNFWKALGKQQGWGEETSSYIVIGGVSDELEGWYLYWHKFIMHIADGGSIDDFFNK